MFDVLSSIRDCINIFTKHPTQICSKWEFYSEINYIDFRSRLSGEISLPLVVNTQAIE